jgi:hypothetical protein
MKLAVRYQNCNDIYKKNLLQLQTINRVTVPVHSLEQNPTTIQNSM